MHEIIHIFEHSIQDTLLILPAIFLIYLLLEYMEHIGVHLQNYKKIGPVVGSLIGLLPECGTSIIASKFYCQRLISLGTLIAIFISSSDEAIILLLTQSYFNWKILLLLVLKFIFGVIVGLLIDRFYTKETLDFTPHPEEHEGSIFKHALEHTLTLIAFVFVCQIVITGIIEFIGEEQLSILLNLHPSLQVFIASLVGLIPNCAGSIALAEVYLNGMLSFRALFAGLCCSSGVGLLTLYRFHPSKKHCLKITLFILVISILAGMLL